MRNIILVFSAVFGIFAFSVLPVSASSLFDVTEEDSPYSADINPEETESSLPDYAVDENGEVLADSVPSVSGNDAVTDAVTYSDVETIVASALAETRSTDLSIADAYLSSTIVEVFSRVADGLPVGWKYVAYRLDSSDSSEGYMLASDSASVNGNYLVFASGSQLIHYYRQAVSTGYQTTYQYKYDVVEIGTEYRVPYGSGQLIYTNMISGYPVLSEINDASVAFIVIPILIFLVFLFVLFRRR